MLVPLPIDEHLDAIREAVRRHRAAIVTAVPGAGKTTRVPPALARDGSVLLLQPRRVAARAIARRIALEQAWTLGREVGWQVRFDRNFSSDTRLLVATEGVLTSRLQQDPMASRWSTIVIDEFHERSIHADVGLALAREAWRARGDLNLVVMSATIEAERVAAYLGGCPIVQVPGRLHALNISYRNSAVEDAVAETTRAGDGAVLVFLPGAPEIRRTAERLRPLISPDVAILPLHGGLSSDEQDAALEPTGRPRVVLATNLAETTVTVPDVTTVVDSGLVKIARYDADRAIDSLETERVSQDSADQRAGRAGRVRDGLVVRLWDARDRLRPHREPEIARVDLAGVVLDVIGWGGDPAGLQWFEAPRADALTAASTLLRRLGAIDAGQRMTPMGRSLLRLPLHPRLGRMLLESGGALFVARACVLLSERHRLLPTHTATTCDLLAAVENDRRYDAIAKELLRSAREPLELLGVPAGSSANLSETEFRRAVFSAYPDRVARRRSTGSDRFVMASGSGARLARESGVVNAEYVVCVDVGAMPAGGDPLIRMATAVEPQWLSATDTRVEHVFDPARGTVRATRLDLYDAMPLAETPVAVDPSQSGPLVAAELIARGPSDRDQDLLRRLAIAGINSSFAEIVSRASTYATTLSEIDLETALSPTEREALRRHAPESLLLPSGRTTRLQYRDGGQVIASAKLQELFGLADSPHVGLSRVPVTFELLSPAGRPVQVTRDLRSFWARGYPEVRKELRARYPRHPWPDDPWTAVPTARPMRRKKD